MSEHIYAEVVTAFKQRNITCEVVPDKAACLERTKELIRPGSSVSFAGSRTAHQVGIHDYLREHSNEYKLFDPYRCDYDWGRRIEINRKGMNADWLVTGANAITRGGEIVNLDGIGNRVGAISFGPRRVLVVAGQNKLVDDMEAAMKRVRDIAAPQNSKRLGFGNPCEADGVCHDCEAPHRICRIWGIVEGQMDPDRIIVLIVEEDLGL